MKNYRKILENYVQYKQPKNIYLGDSTVIQALGERKGRLPTAPVMFSLTCTVLFVRTLSKKLLSLPAITSMGAEIRSDKDKVGLLLSDNCKLHPVHIIEYAQASTVNSAPSLAVWHCRLGHLK